MSNPSVSMPSQQQLVFPLLEALAEAGGQADSQEVYERVAQGLNLGPDVTSATTRLGKRQARYNVFHRSVRWAKQRAELMGLLETPRRGEWKLTGRGRKALRGAMPGRVIAVFATDAGVALWADCEAALRAGVIAPGSVAAILTSPPYPLLRKKAYGNVPAREYVDWMLRMIEPMRNVLADDGSLVINLADAWNPGEATLSLYQERLLIRLEDELGLKLCQRFAWENPSKLPSPAQWVTIERKRVKSSIEQVYWLSAGDPPADNRQVLTAYSEAMRRRVASGGDRRVARPSGHTLSEGAFGKDNGGAIPGNVIRAANTESNSHYIKMCRAQGLPIHPARFPVDLPRFFIKLLTKPGDLIADFFGGSCTTGAEAEDQGRHWIVTERILEYLQGGAYRFAHRPGFRSVLADV